MASTSLSLGDYWDKYLKAKVASGQYGSVTEVVRQALRDMETRDEAVERLRRLIQEAEEGGSAGEFTLEMLEDIKREGRRLRDSRLKKAS